MMYRSAIWFKRCVHPRRACGRLGAMPRSRTRISAADYELLAELRHSLRLFASFSEQAARSAGLTPAQHQALLALKGHGREQPLTIGELAERLLIRHHSAVGLVQRLLARGLVQRSTDASDRRRVRLELRPRGEALLARLTAAHRDELRRIGPQIETLLESLRSGSRRRARGAS
jgi:DNA-binding MarR family transcriptional regulator